jgi:hypothetical protein
MIRKHKRISARADMATKALPHTSVAVAAPTSSGIRKRALRPKNMPAKASPSFTSASEEAPPWLKRSNETPSSATYAATQTSPRNHVSDQSATTPSGVSYKNIPQEQQGGKKFLSVWDIKELSGIRLNKKMGLSKVEQPSQRKGQTVPTTPNLTGNINIPQENAKVNCAKDQEQNLPQQEISQEVTSKLIINMTNTKKKAIGKGNLVYEVTPVPANETEVPPGSINLPQKRTKVNCAKREEQNVRQRKIRQEITSKLIINKANAQNNKEGNLVYEVAYEPEQRFLSTGGLNVPQDMAKVNHAKHRNRKLWASNGHQRRYMKL